MIKNIHKDMWKPQRAKNFDSAIRHFIQTEFPRLGGPKVIDLFCEQIRKFINQFYPKGEYVSFGQLPWCAVAKEDFPGRAKTIAQTKLRPVILSLVEDEDYVKLESGLPFREVTKDRIARIMIQADKNGVELTTTELALMFSYTHTRICQLIAQYEKDHNCILPRRGTVHDMGRSVTHKVQICRKKLLEGKETPDIARECFHSPMSVDKYLLDLHRINFCRKKGMSKEEICFSIQRSATLVEEYLKLIEEIEHERTKKVNEYQLAK